MIKVEKIAGVLSTILILIFISWCLGWLLLGAWYCHPNAEDFSLTSLPRDIGIIPSTIDVMTHYDGRYFVNILHGFNPLAFNWLAGYKLMPVFGILFLAVSFFFLIDTLFIANRFTIALFAMLFTAAHFATTPSLPHDLYWMVSSFVYLYPTAFTFLWVGSYFRYIYLPAEKNSSGWFLATVIPLFCCIGLNEMFLVTNCLLLAGIGFFAFRSSNKLTWQKTIPVLFIGLMCVAFFISSPGISERAADERDPGTSIFNLKTILQSIPDYTTATVSVFNNGILFLGLLIIIIYADQVKLRYASVERLKTSKMLIALILAFFLTGWLMTMAYYIPMQIEICYPSRIFNSSVIPQQLAIFILVPLLLLQFNLGVVLKKIEKQKNILAFIFSLTLLFCVWHSHNNIAQIKTDFNSGAINRLNNIMCTRYATINKAKQSRLYWQTAVVDTITPPAISIYYGPDLSYNRNPEYWNYAYEAYFKLDEIKRVSDTTAKL